MWLTVIAGYKFISQNTEDNVTKKCPVSKTYIISMTSHTSGKLKSHQGMESSELINCHKTNIIPTPMTIIEIWNLYFDQKCPVRREKNVQQKVHIFLNQ